MPMTLIKLHIFITWMNIIIWLLRAPAFLGFKSKMRAYYEAYYAQQQRLILSRASYEVTGMHTDRLITFMPLSGNGLPGLHATATRSTSLSAEVGQSGAAYAGRLSIWL